MNLQINQKLSVLSREGRIVYLPQQRNISTILKVYRKNNNLEIQPRAITKESQNNALEICKTNLEQEDIDKMIKDFNFPLSSETLIEKAKQFNVNVIELESLDGSMLAEDFQFISPVVGPLGKDELLTAFASFKVFEFVDGKANMFSYIIDPFQPNRVFMLGTPRGRFIGPLPGTNIAPKNDLYLGAPAASSLTFNEQGLITKYTVGYVLDRTVGNTGGLGGFYGLLYAFGAPLPFPEAQPYKPSWQYRVFSFLQGLSQKFSKKN